MSMGGNVVNDELRRRADQAASLLDEIAPLQEDLKALYEAAKADGYDMKVFKQIIKEKRKGADYQAAQLETEMLLETYRKGVGLPTTLEEAQKAARDEAGEVPEPKSEKRKRKRPLQ